MDTPNKPDPKSAIQKPLDNLLEGSAAASNSNQWGGWIRWMADSLESSGQLEKDLPYAPLFVGWLLLSSEYICYQLRVSHFMNDLRLDDYDVLDECYQDTLNRLKGDSPPDVFQAIRFAVACRHIIVHKGFPNLHRKPTLRKAKHFDEKYIQDIRKIIIKPSNFNQIRERFTAIENWMDKAVIPSIYTSGPISINSQSPD